MLNARLSLVTLHGNDKPVIQSIPKWGIAGEQTDEFKKVLGLEEIVPLTAKDLEELSVYTPLARDTYRTHILENRTRPAERRTCERWNVQPGYPPHQSDSDTISIAIGKWLAIKCACARSAASIRA